MTAASREPEILLAGGNVSGAVLAGGTVRRATGPWTPAVHALLGYLDGRVPHVPQVAGFDGQGREMLTYLPGRVVEIDSEQLSPAQLTALARWTSGFHEAVAGFRHPGPWRYFPVEHPALICHNDIAPYNACFDGDEVAGVFDWDLAGPSTPRQELAFMAWNCIPLWTDIGPAASARRLELLADGYGGIGRAEILRAVPERIQRMLDFIPAAAAAGDAGMANLLTRGEPASSQRALDGLRPRIPLIARELAA